MCYVEVWSIGNQRWELMFQGPSAQAYKVWAKLHNNGLNPRIRKS